ncbi:MAG: hypothetical protein JWO03_1001 [Bacteroidetes bacterium]|nr:hypothetical protein [Bacteroidota bacterium]
MLKESHKKLSNHDVAFGIGRMATDAELKEYLDRPVGEFKESAKVLKEIKEQLKAKRQKRKAS